MLCFTDDSSMKLSSDCLELVLETMAEGVIFIDKNHIIQYCNKTCETLTGFTRDDIIGRPCDEVLRCRAQIDCTLFKEGNINSAECDLIKSDGSHLPVLKNGRVLSIGGNVLGAVETFSDITSIRLQENRIALLEESLKKISGVPNIIAKSHAMEIVFEQIGFAANSQANTYIYGESGTGKELTARAIHDMSSRSDGPFVGVNCSALPESLLESELFGHVKGSFTGAIRDKKGRFELAEGGTLFLDEIGDISPLIQVKLLRFLQEKEFERVGDSVTRKADVRIITATNKDLKKLVQEGIFREDLYYRLNVFPIVLPPLRQRKEDVTILVQHFLKKYSDITGKKIEQVTSEVLLLMMDYDWPGNVRELENAIEHAFVTCQGDTIGPMHLPRDIRVRDMPLMPMSLSANPMLPPLGKRKSIDKEELQLILEQFQYNKSETARYLGVDRTTLWRWMKKHKLDVD